MNFLELCKDVARESGTLAGGGFSLQTVAGATGRADKIVAWTAKAWLAIQSERRDWLWMRREFTGTLIAGNSRYTASSLNVARVAEWLGDRCEYMPLSLYDPTIGVKDEGTLVQTSYDYWRTRYGRGYSDQDRPTEYAISPQMELCFGAIPDKAYAIRGEYRVTGQRLVDDADIPEMPEDYHPAIVWEALRLMADADEAPLSIQTTTSEYSIARYRLDRDQTPRVELGGWPPV